MKEHLNRPFDKETLVVLGIILIAFVSFVSFWFGGTVVSLQTEMQNAKAGAAMSRCTSVYSEGVRYVMCPGMMPPAPVQ